MEPLATLLSWVSQHWLLTSFGFLLLAIIAEQITFQWKGRNMPGPLFVVPVIGNIIQMVFHPYDFWHTQFAMGKLSWNSIVGKFLVIVSDASYVRKIFEATSERMPLVLHPNAYKILGANNIAFMNGNSHKELRFRLLPLFTQKALSVYLTLQEKAIYEHTNKWFELSKNAGPNGLVMKQLIWDLNANTSLSVFVGPYLTPVLRSKISACYRKVTDGFLSFPIYFPGTGLWQGVKSKVYIVEQLQQMTAQSKTRMRNGEEPSCLLDFWMQATIKEIDEAKAANKPAPPHSSDYEVACTVLDFLFASQDASTASLTWCIHYLSLEPAILQRIREEQAEKRPHNESFTTEIISSLTYTSQVMREILRFRPPATMVPHICLEDTVVGDKSGQMVNVSKGSMVVPSIWSACHSGFTNPEQFDPDRFSRERQEDKKFEKFFIPFGAGPHVCLGQRYAMNHIMCFLSILSTTADFVRKQTKDMHKIMYAPTIYPADECVLSSFQPRKQVVQ